MIREQGSTVVTWLCGSFSNTAAACHGSWENNYFAQTALSELNLSSHVDLGHQKSVGALHWCSYYCSKPWAALLQVWAQGSSSTKCSFWAGCTKHGIATLPAWQEKKKRKTSRQLCTEPGKKQDVRDSTHCFISACLRLFSSSTFFFLCSSASCFFLRLSSLCRSFS